MARIIRFEKNKEFNLDTQMLSIDGKEVGKALKGIPYRIIEYLAENTNVRLTQEQIRSRCWKEDTGSGSVAYHINKARTAIMDEKPKGKRDFKYIVECDGKYYCPYPIECSGEDKAKNKVGEERKEGREDILGKENENVLSAFISFCEGIESSYLNSLLDCERKWGACTYDIETQNTNTCEGILALLMSSQKDAYLDIIDSCMEELLSEIKDEGLVSKSLSIATVVPTSMFLYIASIYKNIDRELITTLTSRLWEAKDELGWGLYTKRMGKHANIGCTYWASIGIVSCGLIEEERFQLMLKSLFRFDNVFSFGSSIKDINPKIPSLYATSMMYILYSMLSEENKKIVEQKYHHRKALSVIKEYFDNPFFLIEEEGINGVEIGGKTSVHTVNWNHITIHYCLYALSLGILNNEFKKNEIVEITQRVEKTLKENSQIDGGKAYWCGPKMPLNKGSRGKLIFPTMHVLMGLSHYKNAILSIVHNEGD